MIYLPGAFATLCALFLLLAVVWSVGEWLYRRGYQQGVTDERMRRGFRAARRRG